jgi:hypothetical protein
MVPSSKLSFVANDNNPTGFGLTLGSTIHFGSLKFTADHLGCLNLSPHEWDSSAIFRVIVHNGSPSLHTAFVDSSDDDGDASGVGRNYGSLGPRGCNVVTPTDPITTTPAPKNTLALQTIPTVMVQRAIPHPRRELLPDQWQAYQEAQ